MEIRGASIPLMTMQKIPARTTENKRQIPNKPLEAAIPTNSAQAYQQS